MHIVKRLAVSRGRLTGTSTVTDQHLLGTDRDIPDPLFSGLLNKPSLPTGHSLFKLEAKPCILRSLLFLIVSKHTTLFFTCLKNFIHIPQILQSCTLSPICHYQYCHSFIRSTIFSQPNYATNLSLPTPI